MHDCCLAFSFIHNHMRASQQSSLDHVTSSEALDNSVGLFGLLLGTHGLWQWHFHHALLTVRVVLFSHWVEFFNAKLFEQLLQLLVKLFYFWVSLLADFCVELKLLYECLIERSRLSLTSSTYLATFEMAYFLASESSLNHKKNCYFSARFSISVFSCSCSLTLSRMFLIRSMRAWLFSGN